jgi:branched-chain amino acid transport system ATP-binding protein
MALLQLEDVHTYYGHIHALKGISLDVDEGEIVTLIGANGAGKSTTLRTISGLVRPRNGSVKLSGRAINHTQPHEITKLGIGHVPEGRRIFAELTVQENLEMGAFTVARADVQRRIDATFSLFPRLKERLNQLGGTLSGGDNKCCDCAPGAPAAHPLLDEPRWASRTLSMAFSEIIMNPQERATILLVSRTLAWRYGGRPGLYFAVQASPGLGCRTAHGNGA